MNTLREAIDDYLTMRRALGFKLTRVGWKLKHLADFLESHGADTITTLLPRNGRCSRLMRSRPRGPSV